MRFGKMVVSTLMLGTVLAAAGCSTDDNPCACSYPEDDKSSGSSKDGKSEDT